MLTPLDALGVAAAAVQFIDFTSSFISRAREIHKSGASVEAKVLREKTLRLIAWNSGLRDRKKRFTGDGSAEDRLEKGLDDVLTNCCDLADRLIALLGKLSTPNKGLVGSVRTAFVTVFNQSRLQHFDAELKAYRDDIAGHTLALLNEKLERQYDDFTAGLKRLEEKQDASSISYERILEILTFSKHTQKVDNSGHEPLINEFEYAVLASQGAESEESEQVRVVPYHYDEQLISAVLFMRDAQGNKIPVYLSPLSSFSSHQQEPPETWQRNQLIQTTTMFQEGKEKLYTGQFTTLVRSVINALRFSGMHQREFAIADAHRSTFEWIFQPKDVSDTSHDPEGNLRSNNLVDFLETASGFFWISGKPGSGKSTLMKFICDHEVTRGALAKWTGPHSLVIRSHFLWYGGGNLHSSLEGLLRSLLNGILSKHSELVPIAFPDACRDFVNGLHVAEDLWAFPRLQSALHRVLSHEQRRFRLCLFLDGADEILGTPEVLCVFLQDLIQYPGVKAVVSSRPWNIFELQFRYSPSIRVQDLTREDIRSYAQEKLADDAFTSTSDANMLQDLVEGITERSSGVFLWVHLVVKSLRQGLIDGDLPRELLQRFEQMPSELEDFYRTIFESMEPHYREEAARIFYIMVRASEMGLLPLNILQMNSALDETLETATYAPHKLMLSQERAVVTRRIERKLQSRTRGLAETVRSTIDTFSGSSAIGLRVNFIHKTALDFLYMPETQANLSKIAPTFDPNAALLAGCLYEIKALPTEDAIILSSDQVWVDLSKCLLMASSVEFKWRRPYTVVTDELNRALSKHWSAAQMCKPAPYQQEWFQTSDFDGWSAFYLEYKFKEEVEDSQFRSACLRKDVDHFLILATLTGCVLYVANKTLAVTYDDKFRTEILAEMVALYFAPRGERQGCDGQLWHFNLMTAINQLLRQGANPNGRFITPVGDRLGRRPLTLSIWEYYLTQVTAICHKDEGQSLDVFRETDPIQAAHLFRICTSFLTSHANQTITVAVDAPDPANPVHAKSMGSPPLSVEDILRRLRTTSLDPSDPIFVGSKNTKELENVYQEAMSAYRLRKSTPLKSFFGNSCDVRVTLKKASGELLYFPIVVGFTLLVVFFGWLIHLYKTKEGI